MAERRAGFGSDLSGDRIDVTIGSDTSEFRKELLKLVSSVEQVNKKIVDEISKSNKAFREQQEEIKKTVSALDKLGGSALSVGSAFKALAASYLVIKGYDIAREAVNTAVAFERAKLAINAAAGGVQAGAQQFKFLREESEKTGFVFLDASRNYGQLLAAIKSSGGTTETAQRVFSDYAKIVATLGLNANEANSIFVALSQTFSKNKVQAQEATIQIGQRLAPFIGTLKKVVKEAGFELDDAFKKGVVGTGAVIEVGKRLVEQYKDAIPSAIKSATAELNRYENSVNELKKSIGDELLPILVKDILPVLKDLSSTIISLIKDFSNLKTTFSDIGSSGSFAVETFRILKIAAQGYLDVLQRIKENQTNAKDNQFQERSKDIIEKQIDARKRLVEYEQEALVVQLKLEEIATGKATRDLVVQQTSLAQIYGSLGQKISDTNKELAQYQQILGMINNEQKRFKSTQISNESAPFGPELPIDNIIIPSNKDDERARKKAESEAEQYTKKREQLEEELYKSIAKFGQDEYDAFLRVLDDKVAEFREYKLNVEDIEKFYTLSLADFRRKQAQEEFAQIKKQAQDIAAANDDLKDKLIRTDQDKYDRDVELLYAYLEEKKQVGADEILLREYEVERLSQINNEYEQRKADEAIAALEKERQAFDQLAGSISQNIGDVIFDSLQGGINNTKDLLKSLKDTFFRVIADIAAKSLTTNIIIPVMADLGIGGGGGASGALTTGGGRGSSFGSILGSVGNLLTQDQTLFSRTSDGRFVLGDVQGSAEAQRNISAAIDFGDFSPQQQGVSATSVVGEGGVTGAVVSGIAGAALAQLVTEFTAENISRNIFGETGAGGRVANIHAGITGGVVGGAVAGLQYAGVFGAVVGAVVGAIVGGIVGGLKSVAKKRAVELRDVQIPKFVSDQLGVSLSSGFKVLDEYSRNARPEQFSQFKDAVQSYADDFLFGTQSLIQSFPKEFQRILPSIINEDLEALEAVLNEELKVKITSRKGSSLTKAIEEFINVRLPELFNDVFGETLERAQRLASIFQGFDEVLEQLEGTRDALARSFRDQRQQLEELLFTPAQTFEKRKGQLENVLALFDSGTQAEKIALAPQIQSLISELSSLAPGEGVLGQDLPLLIQYQQELLGILDDVERDSLNAVNSQIEITLNTYNVLLHQTDILTGTREVFEQGFREANITLDNIQQFLETATTAADLGTLDPRYAQYLRLTREGFFENFNAATGGSGGQSGLIQQILAQGGSPASVGGNIPTFASGGIMPYTGLAYLHAGESIYRPGEAGQGASVLSINIEQNINGNIDNGTANNVANKTAEAVAVKLEQMSRFAQTKISKREPSFRQLRTTTPRPSGA